jgi:hypothetical protein
VVALWQEQLAFWCLPPEAALWSSLRGSAMCLRGVLETS